MDLEQAVDCHGAFAGTCVIDRFLRQSLLRQGCDMAACNDDRLLRDGVLDRLARFAGRRHLLGRGRGLVPEYDHADEARRASFDFGRY